MNIMSEGTRRRLGIEILGLALFLVKMDHQRRVQPLGIARNVMAKIEGVMFHIAFIVIRMKEVPGGYPMLLG